MYLDLYKLLTPVCEVSSKRQCDGLLTGLRFRSSVLAEGFNKFTIIYAINVYIREEHENEEISCGF